MYQGDDLTTAASTLAGATLPRVAAGLVAECRDVGRSTRVLASPVDALVVHAMVAARARREKLPVVIDRAGQRVAVELGDSTEVAVGTVTTWSIAGDGRDVDRR